VPVSGLCQKELQKPEMLGNLSRRLRFTTVPSATGQKRRRRSPGKRQELARVVERLRSPPLSHGMARELRKQQVILEREIAELEK
jgi:hypothetical protein